MLRETNMPSILIEGGFMDSTIDIKKMRDDKVLDAAGKAVALGLAEHFKLKKKPAPKPKPSGKLYKVQIGAFKNKANADQLAFRAKARGFDHYVLKQDGLFKVQIGAYSVKKNADTQAAKAKKAGFDTYIVHE